MVSKAQERLSIGRRIKDTDDEITKFYGLIRNKISTPNTIAIPLGGEGSAAGDAAQDFLRKAGDSMIGPLAFFESGDTIISGVIDVGPLQPAQFTSRLVVNGEGIANDDLDTILNASFSGQLLMLQAGVGQVITLKHLTGNIRCGTGGDIAIGGNANIWLVFDSTQNQWTTVGVASDSAVAGGAFATQQLNNLLVTAVNVGIFPGVTNTIDLGEDTTPLRWRNYYGHQFDIFDFGEFTERVGQPATTANKVQLYARDKAGVSNLYFQDDAGTEFDLSVAAGGANTDLSNLINPTAINQDLQPDLAGDGIRDLGDFSFFWDTTFTRRVSFRDDKGIVNSESGIGSNPTSLWLNQTILTSDIGLYWDGTQVVSFDRNQGRLHLFDPMNELRIDGGSGRTFSLISPGLTGDVLFTLLGGAASQGFKFAQFVEFGLASGIIIQADGDADFQANNIIDINNITSSTNGIIDGFDEVRADLFAYVNDPTVINIDPSASGFDYNVGVGDFQTFKFGGVPVVQFVAGGATFFEGVSLNDVLTISGGGFIDIADITEPASPSASFTRIFLDDVDGVLKVKKPGGSVVSLESGGGGQNQTPWLSDIDAAGFDLNDVSAINLRDDGSLGGGRIVFDALEDSDTWIGNDIGGTDTVIFRANNFTVMQYSPSGLTMLGGPLRLPSQYAEFGDIIDAAVPTPGTADGRVFMRQSTGELSIRKDDSSIVSLEAGAAGGNAWSDPVDSNIIPDTNNTYDLGQESGPQLKFRDGFFRGKVQMDNLQVLKSAVIQGTNGLGPSIFFQYDNFSLGNDVEFLTTIDKVSFRNLRTQIGFTGGETIIINALFDSSLIPDNDNLRDLGVQAGDPPSFRPPAIPFGAFRWRNIRFAGELRNNNSTMDGIQITTPSLNADDLNFTGNLRQLGIGNPQVGFFGATPVGQQPVTGPSGEPIGNAASIVSIIQLLQAYGLT